MDAQETAQQGRQHIFAINGSAEFLNLIRDLFEESRYNITTTNFVPNSCAQIAALQPDLLTVDVAVGQQAGWDLLERRHKEAATTSIPVIIVSTSPQLPAWAEVAAARYGSPSYLEKPFELDALLGIVERLIGPA